MNRKPSKRIRRLATAAFILSAAIVWSYWYTHPNGQVQFERVVGMAPPAGVREIVANRPLFNVISMDTVVLLRFTADQRTIQQVIAIKNLEADPVHVIDFYDPTDGYAALWRKAFGNFAQFGNSGWHEPKLVEPFSYKGRAPNSLIDWTLIWDRSTEQAWGLYTIG